MLNFILYPSNFNFLNKTFTTILVTYKNFEELTPCIEKCIKLFNDEIIWSEMFDIIQAEQRVKDGKELYIGLIEDKIFGYVWFEDHKDGKKIFNVFVKNNEKDRKYKGSEFVSYIIKEFNSNFIIYAEVDEWNIKSIRMFEKLGFINQ